MIKLLLGLSIIIGLLLLIGLIFYIFGFLYEKLSNLFSSTCVIDGDFDDRIERGIGVTLFLFAIGVLLLVCYTIGNFF